MRSVTGGRERFIPGCYVVVLVGSLGNTGICIPIKNTNGDLRHETSQTERMVTVLKGRLEKGSPNFDASKMANDNIAALCAYLKGRSDG